MLDFAAGQVAIGTDRREWADVRVSHRCARSDDGGAAHRAGGNRSPRFDDDWPDERRFRVDRPVDPALQRTKDEPVGFEHVVFLAGVDPIVPNCLRPDLETGVDQRLNCVGDLQFTSRGWCQGGRNLMHLRSEVVDTDYREIRYGLSW